jgi:hypothetical protein
MMRAMDWAVNGMLGATQVCTTDELSVRFDSCGPRRKNFRLELEALLEVLHQKHGRLSVMYSGGADSEMLVRELDHLGIPFESHFVVFSNGSNKVDFECAAGVQNALGFRMYIHMHDVESYIFSGKHVEDGLRYLSSDLSLLTAYRYAEKIGLPTILGPELLLQKHQKPGPVNADMDWYVVVGEHSLSAQTFMDVTRVPMYGELYFHSSSLLHSILQWDGVQHLINNQMPGRISMSYVKNPMMEQALGYKFSALRKRHGYEVCYHTFRRGVNDVKASLPFIQAEAHIPVQQVIAKLEQP